MNILFASQFPNLGCICYWKSDDRMLISCKKSVYRVSCIVGQRQVLQQLVESFECISRHGLRRNLSLGVKGNLSKPNILCFETFHQMQSFTWLFFSLPASFCTHFS